MRPADLAAHRMKEGHRAPVGQELVAAHRVGQIGAAGREHGLRPLPQGPELGGPAGSPERGRAAEPNRVGSRPEAKIQSPARTPLARSSRPGCTS